MKRVVVVLVGVLCTLGSIIAQNITIDTTSAKKIIFRNSFNQDALESIDKTLVTEHPFGDVIAGKMYLLQDTYTYTEAPTPTSPSEKTVVLKPVVYNAVLKLNRNLKKSVKKGTIEQATATKDLDHCLDIALSISADDTADLEVWLRKAKTTEDILWVFSLVDLR
jgi:hypothetical protein